MPHALGVDVGSTNVKAVLVDDTGEVRGAASRNLSSRRDGEVAEQDPEVLWQAVVGAASEAVGSDAAAAADVAAIGVCSQYSSIVPVGPQGRPTAPLVTYLDRRGSDHSRAVLRDHEEALGLFVERHGIPPIGGGTSLAHIQHFQHDRPEVHDATSAYLEPMDYVNARLTGRIAANQCTVFMTQLCDDRHLGVTRYDADLVRLAGIDDSRLPPLSPVDAPVGTVLPEVAGLLGVPATAVVQAAMNDSQAGAYATGAFLPGRVGLSIGTTAVLLDAVTDKAVDLDHEILTMPSPERDAHLVWAENGLAGKAVEHVLEELVYASDELGEHVTEDSFAMLDQVLDSVPPGSDGVLFLPWLSGSMSPRADGRVRGGFLNLSLDTRRVHLVRAAVEGTAHNLAWLLPAVEGFTGTPVDEVVFGGGAARSRGWSQILADVLDRPVRPLVGPDRAVARAVALVALWRHGTVTRSDLDELVETSATHEPDPRLRERYALTQTQFEAAFDALAPIYRALNRRR
jgi:xylulokinase